MYLLLLYITCENNSYLSINKGDMNTVDLSQYNIPAPFDGRVALKNINRKWMVRQLRFYPKTGDLCEAGGAYYEGKFEKPNRC